MLDTQEYQYQPVQLHILAFQVLLRTLFRSKYTRIYIYIRKNTLNLNKPLL